MTAPDLATYRAIHLALRAGADTMATVAATVQPADRPRATALVRYWDGYAAALHKHHTTEDDVFFPALVEKVPVAAALIARTDAEHADLDAITARCHHAVAALATGVRSDDLAGAFTDLAAHLALHLDFEDEDILPLFERHLSVDEYAALDAAGEERLTLRAALFIVPFVVQAVPSTERAHLLDGAPRALRVIYRLARPGYDRLLRTLRADRALVAVGAA